MTSFSPEEYQLDGIDWLADNPHAGLFWDPGLGKTSTVLHAVEILLEDDEIDTVLVVATKRIAGKVWGDEVHKWRLPFRVSKVLGTERQRLEALSVPAEIYLLNYENIPWLIANWKATRFGRCMLVADESTKLKHTNTKRFKALKPTLPAFARRVILTGTPVPNGLHDIYGQVYVMDEGAALGKYVTHFRRRWFYPTGYGGYTWKLQRGAEEEIHAAIGHLVHRANASLIDLPELRVVDRRVTLPPVARKAYRDMEDHLVAEVREGTVSVASASARYGKLRQMANGAVYGVGEDASDVAIARGEGKEVHVLHEEKAAALVSIIEEHEGQPVLVGYQYRHDLAAIEKALLASDIRSLLPRDSKRRPFVPAIGGGTGARESTQLIDRWNAGAYPVLCGHYASVSHGLNLQGGGSAVVCYSLPDNLEEYEQFYRRLWRRGQERPVTLFRLVAEETVDEDTVKLVEGKDRTQKAFLDAMLERTRRRS